MFVADFKQSSLYFPEVHSLITPGLREPSIAFTLSASSGVSSLAKLINIWFTTGSHSAALTTSPLQLENRIDATSYLKYHL